MEKRQTIQWYYDWKNAMCFFVIDTIISPLYRYNQSMVSEWYPQYDIYVLNHKVIISISYDIDDIFRVPIKLVKHPIVS